MRLHAYRGGFRILQEACRNLYSRLTIYLGLATNYVSHGIARL
jgi:hypothetical protein